MSYLKKNPIMEILLGPPPGDSTSSPTRGKLNLCRTRVQEIRFIEPDQTLRFFQKDANSTRWIFEGPVNYELSELFMEKWLAQNCSVKVDSFLEDREPVAKAGHELLIKYVDGSTQTFVRAEESVFLTSDSGWVVSSELESALRLLDPRLKTSSP